MGTTVGSFAGVPTTMVVDNTPITANIVLTAAESGRVVVADTSAGGVVCELPTSPPANTVFWFSKFSTNNSTNGYRVRVPGSDTINRVRTGSQWPVAGDWDLGLYIDNFAGATRRYTFGMVCDGNTPRNWTVFSVYFGDSIP